MARRKSPGKPTAAPGKGSEDGGLSSNPVTNMVIADIVMRGASAVLRKRVETGMLTGTLAADQATKLVNKRGLISTVALWGASRLATRSPLGLVVVAGGLAAKVFYDRGKLLEAKRRPRKRGKPES